MTFSFTSQVAAFDRSPALDNAEETLQFQLGLAPADLALQQFGVELTLHQEAVGARLARGQLLIR